MKTKLIILPVILLLLSGCIYESVDGRSGGEDIDELSTKLLAYYTFDNGTLEDNSQFSNDASFGGNNGVFIDDTPSNSGKALSLNAFQKQFMIIPYGLLNNKPNFSICFWIKDFGNGNIIRTSNGSRSILSDENGYLFIDGYLGKTTSYNCTQIQSDGWHHLVFASGDGKIYVYVDGYLKDTQKWDDRGDGNLCTSFQVGPGTYAGSYTTNMKIDNLRFYYENISSDKVRKIYDYEK